MGCYQQIKARDQIDISLEQVRFDTFNTHGACISSQPAQQSGWQAGHKPLVFVTGLPLG
jgi:hypothetical protein